MSTQKSFEINNYVLYKYKDEWLECRIHDLLIHEDTPIKYILYILKYKRVNNDPVTEECIYRCSFENEKKFKVTKTYKFPEIFIDWLKEDRAKIKNNLIVKLSPDEHIRKPGRRPKNEPKIKISNNKTVKIIVNEYADFLASNKIIFEEEIDELRVGLNFLFNNVIKNLLYDNEMKQFENINLPCNEIYGIEHLIRMLYYVYGKNEILDEYLYYFFDYLELNYEIYFNDRKYEELK